MSAQPAKNVKAPKESGLTVISPEAMAMYAYVWRPRPAMDPTKEAQFSIVLLFKKGTDLSTLRSAARLAATKKWGNKIPGNIKNPFRKGNTDRPDDPIFKDVEFITARTNSKPGIVDAGAQPILDELEFYSGCKCRASLYAMAYDTVGNKGVTFLLNNIQKLGDGPRLSGRKPAEEEFSAVEGENDDDDDNPF